MRRPVFEAEEDDVADLLGRIERLLEDAVEGTSRRLFRAELQPVELAKAASRAMQEREVIGPDGPEVPNRYRIRMNPGDFARFAPYRHSLEGKIVAYLDRFAADRGLQPVADWQVELVSDQSVKTRAIAIDAEMTDPPGVAGGPGVTDGPAEPDRWLDGTVAVDRVAAPARATLVAADGREFRLSDRPTTIGRALDNDVVIADARVSRYHAQVRRGDGGYVVRDLGSTNGTTVAGRRVAEHRLAHGDEISLGGYLLSVRFERAAG